MTGIAIISLDCEGRWGVADHLTPAFASKLSDARLKEAYRQIVTLFEEFQVPATFAFVELFTRSRSRQLTGLIEELASELPYLRSAAQGISAGDEGWIGDWALEMASNGSHEIAFHGATHVPWPELTASQARRELEMTQAGHRQTMVFPRNQVAHLDVLAEFGCRGFRSKRCFSSRAHSLFSEFDLNTKSQHFERRAEAELEEIPSGVFVNWRSGLRSVVPTQVTRLRARRMLEDASATGGVAHFWLHPENIATAPTTFENLKAIVEEIVSLRDRGKIIVETQLSALDSIDKSSEQKFERVGL